jgi:hypothetical protein
MDHFADRIAGMFVLDRAAVAHDRDPVTNG